MNNTDLKTPAHGDCEVTIESQLIANLCGEWMPLPNAKLHIFDMGIAHGVSVTEILRTFRHQLFEAETHLDRLWYSLSALEIDPPVTREQLHETLEEVVTRNAAIIPPSHDLIVNAFVTAGPNLSYLGHRTVDWLPAATWCVSAFPIAAEHFADAFSTGVRLSIPDVHAIPKESVDPRIKSRSRVHWYLADQAARKIDPRSRALLTDSQCNVTETGTGNVIAIRDGMATVPPDDCKLGGVSERITLELLNSLGIPSRSQHLKARDLHESDEVFVTSTPYGTLPVVALDNIAIGSSSPGPVFAELLRAWKNRVGVDLAVQMQSMAADRSTQS